MSNSLHAPRSMWPPPRRSWAEAVWGRLPGLVWRGLHPLARERFLAEAPPAPLPRLTVATPDGWSLPLWRCPPAPGASGEPVVLLPPVGTSAHVFRVGGDDSLCGRLVASGFAPYLPGTRLGADADGTAAGGAPRFDDAVRLDLPAIVDAVVEHSGYPRVHVVGYGLGGQVALAWAADALDARLASLALWATAVRYPDAPDGVSAVERVVRRLTGAWRVPERELGRWRALGVAPGPGAARQRGALAWASDDVALTTLHELAAWHRAGALLDRAGGREVAAALGAVRAPLWLSTSDADPWCRPAWALPLVDVWRGGVVDVHRVQGHDGDGRLAHLDLLLHPDHAPVAQALLGWLERQRVRAWRET